MVRVLGEGLVAIRCAEAIFVVDGGVITLAQSRAHIGDISPEKGDQGAVPSTADENGVVEVCE